MQNIFQKNLENKIPKSFILHFIGIMGTGMSPLALLFAKLGYKVQGSDLKIDAELDALLKKNKIPFFEIHSEKNILHADLIIYSSAIQESHCEIIAAKRSGKALLHRSDLLSYLTNIFPSICVAGTHGKTTTSAMIAHMLHGMIEESFACVGGILKNNDSPIHFPNKNSDLNQLSYFVAEADESDGSFLKYTPFLSVVNNCEEDHMDFYKDKNQLFEIFQKYILQTREDGFLIVGWDCLNLRNISQSYCGNRLAFGFSLGCDVRAIQRNCQDASDSNSIYLQSFKAIVERDVVDVRLQIPGKHNVLNALAALSVARSLELDIEKAANVISSFEGVKRRLEKIADCGSQITIFDDYAHNPGKIKACVQSLRELYPNRELRIIFQPHRYSRLRTLYNEFIESMLGADRVFIINVYAAGEEFDSGYDPIAFAMDLANSSHTQAEYVPDPKILSTCVHGVESNCVFLCVGAGDVWKFAKKIEEHFAKKEVKQNY